MAGVQATSSSCKLKEFGSPPTRPGIYSAHYELHYTEVLCQKAGDLITLLRKVYFNVFHRGNVSQLNKLVNIGFIGWQIFCRPRQSKWLLYKLWCNLLSHLVGYILLIPDITVLPTAKLRPGGYDVHRLASNIPKSPKRDKPLQAKFLSLLLCS